MQFLTSYRRRIARSKSTGHQRFFFSSLFSSEHHFDLVVIGGGSGGLACSKQAATLGKNVAVLDYVTPSPKGSKWGLGGTCVNVGCIPKKLMHTAGIMRGHLEDCNAYGWGEHTINHDWTILRQNVQDYIRGLNWGYKTQLREKNVSYLNKLGSFYDERTISTIDHEGQTAMITADNIVIAVGGRPRQLSCPGSEHCITSDDIFSLEENPGKTLCVGASYISLECAGFLAEMGIDVTVMVRSILLRGFDQQMADKVGEGLEAHGVKFLRSTTPQKIEKLQSGKLLVHYSNSNSNEVEQEEFDTVIAAVGRDADTSRLNCAAAGVKTANSGKIVGDNRGCAEQSSQDNIYAIGDCLEGYPELTPVAIQAGKHLADRLFAGSTLHMDYVNVPTTVFTPVEYGTCGLSEESAEQQIGKENLTVYHSEFIPLEWALPYRYEKVKCYMKLLCKANEQNRVVGFHYFGPNAGEVTQGFGLAMKLGATKLDFESVVGIHPTCAEGFTTLKVIKGSGESEVATGC